MRIWKKVSIGFLVVTGVVVAFGCYEITHMNLDSAITPFARMAIAAPASLLVIQREDPVMTELKKAPLLEAYESNPKAFELNAKLIETLIDALAVSEKANSSGRQLPFLSDAMKDQTVKHVDSWGNPFCVSGDASTLMIISGGDSGKRLSCTHSVSTASLIDIPRKRLIKTDSGYLILVVDRKESRTVQGKR